MFSPRKIHTTKRRQQGAALMIMLIIAILGSIAFLVSAMSSSAITNARNQTTADALAQAKDALISRAASDAIVPGSLPCPDTHAPGSLLEGTADVGTPCTYYIGRLPWKTLGLPDLRDSSGERLWYALSSNYQDVATSTVNSDTLGTISVFAPDGTLLNDGSGSNGAVAVIIAPGSVLTRQGGVKQDRSSTGFTTASNYLDVATISGNTQDNAVFTGSSTATSGFIQGTVKDNNGNTIVNDQIMLITRDQLMPVVEMRIAREVKKCLDDYAADPSNTYHRYPWAVPISDSTTYPTRTGSFNVFFGRIGEIPNIDTTSGGTPPTGPVLINIQAVQTALNSYISNPSSSNLNALNNAGDVLKDSTPPGPPHDAGVTANDCTDLSCTSTLAYQLYTAMGGGTPDMTMPLKWTSSCTMIPSSSYWTDWRDLVFYQIASGYQPSTGTGSGCTAGSTCLTISGTGNTTPGFHNDYRATVIVSRQALPGQSRPSTNISDYLDSSNQTPGSSPPTYVTFKPSDTSFATINDLVQCLDGGVNCN